MIKIKVTNNIDRFINKCINNNINITNIKRDKDTLICNIDNSDLDQISKLNYYSEIEVIKYYGIKQYLIHIKKYYYDYLVLFLFILLIYLSSNFIISIDILHENKEIKTYTKEIIKKYGIKPLTLKKDLNTLNKISDEIINKYKDTIDWISINNIGMKYIVSIEERIINEEQEKDNYCHVISTKDAIITKLIPTSGISLIEKGSHVHKGDILIIGEITQNEEVKKNTCADGEVYGETWYKVHISYPLQEEIQELTGEYRYNFKYNDRYFYKKNYDNYKEEVIYNYKNISIVKQSEYIIKTKEYELTEARNNAIEKATNKLLNELDKNSKVISQKVLKQTHDYSKIELDIFISVEELISKRITYEVGETNGNDTG